MTDLGYHESRHSIFHSLNAVPCHRQKSAFLSGLVAEDVRVTGIQDGHGGATEELSEGSAQLNLQKGKKCEPKNPPKPLSQDFFSGPVPGREFPGTREKGCTYVASVVVVDGNLAQHGEVLDLRLPQGLEWEVSVSAVERNRISMQLTGVLEAICSRRVSQEDKGRQYSDGRTHQDELRLSRSEALEGL